MHRAARTDGDGTVTAPTTAAPRVPPRDAGSAQAGARRKILVFIDSGTVSGPVRQLAAVIRPLSAAGYDMHCVAFQRAGKPAITSPAFLETMGATVSVLTDARAFDPSLAGRMAQVVEAVQPDLIETHSYRPAVLMALLRQSRRVRVPWIGWFHGSTAESLSIKLYNRLDHLALRFADLVIVMSEKQLAEKAGYRTPVRILYNAAIEEASAAAPAERLRELLASAPAPRIGVVGRISPEKGVDIAIDAWARLVAAGQAGTLVIAGDGPERAVCEAQVDAAGVRDRVVFLGHLSGTRHLYPLLDMLLIPSRSEGLPNTLLEALQHAHLAIVSTRVGAVPELVEGKAAVRLSDVGDAAQLADNVRRTLANDSPSVREPSRQALLSQLSLAAKVGNIVDSYEQVLHAAMRAR